MLLKFDRYLEKITFYLTATFLISMIIFSFLSILFRWLSMTITWIDPLVRHLVFYTTFLGGVLAIGKNGHIKIDILSIYLKQKKLKKVEKFISLLINFVCSFTLLWLAYAAYLMFVMESKFGRDIFLGVHSSTLIFGIVIGFVLLFTRFLLKIFLPVEISNE